MQVEYSEKGAARRLTNLRLSVFCDPKNPWKWTADLGCKSGKAKRLLPALLPVLKKFFVLEKEQELKLNDLCLRILGKASGSMGSGSR